MDYSDDVDTGPARITHKYNEWYDWDTWSRHFAREDHHWVKRFIRSCVGKSWDECYSKVCEKYDVRTSLGASIRKSFTQESLSLWIHGFRNRWYSHYYVDDYGIICHYQSERRERPAKTPERVHWHGNVWFESEQFRRAAKCGCINFKWDENGKKTWWTDGYCSHGNKCRLETLWYVVEYGYHDPNDIYSVDRERNEDGTISVSYRYYYQYPDKITYKISRKSANGKELKALRKILWS